MSVLPELQNTPAITRGTNSVEPAILTLVRLKILKRVRGELERVRLDDFEVGCTYEVEPALARCLLALDAVAPEIDGQPVNTIPKRKAYRRRARRDTL